VKNTWRSSILFAVLVAFVGVTSVWPAKASDEPRVIEITAKRFEFSPSQITVKKGHPVTLRLTSQDVKHGFFVKELKLDADLHPGKPTEVTFTPQTAGKYLSVCDNFCGSGHGDMRMTIVVE
jgi:cytochrome c oxidase subunit II